MVIHRLDGGTFGIEISFFDKVSEACYLHMYLANTTPPDEGTQTHSHA